MDKKISRFTTAGEIHTGLGAVDGLGEVARRFGSRGVLVTGRTAMRQAGVMARVQEILSAAGLAVELFDAVTSEPTVQMVDAVREIIGRVDAEFVIGLGGGSPMDAAKAAAGLAREFEPTAVFLHDQKGARPGIPLVTVPTTSGTGAEVTPNAVITDPAKPIKLSLRGGRYMPAAAIVDPVLTVSCPQRVTAYAGMDAVTQAIESFVSIHAGPVSDALAFDAFRLLWNSLDEAYADGSNLPARADCAYASLMAGMALSSARLGAIHGIVHPLGARYHIPHGLACAALLPVVIRRNLPYAAGKFSRLAGITGGDIADEIRELNEYLGIYEDLARYRVPQEDFALIARESMPSGSLKANPKPFTEEDVIAVLRAVFAMG